MGAPWELVSRPTASPSVQPFLVPGKRAWAVLAGEWLRRLRVDNRMLRRWRKGTQPDPGHLVALFTLAAEIGLLHLLLPAVGEPKAVELSTA